MSKIAIISQAEQGVLIDISGCSSIQEAKQYLTSTLQVSSQFWDGLTVDLNLGPLVLTAEQVSEIQAIVSEVGVQPRQIYSLSPITRAALIQCYMPSAKNSLLEMPVETNCESSVIEAKAQLISSVTEIEAEQVNCSTLSAVAETCVDGLAGADLAGCSSHADSTGIAGQAAQIDPTNYAEQLPGFTVVNFRPETEPALDCGTTDGVTPIQTACAESTVSEAQTTVSATMPSSKILQTKMIAAGMEMPVAIPAAKAPVKESKPAPANKTAAPAVLLMKQHLRSGQHVSHKGHLVIIGDVNPGAELVADGDITVWGALRGMAHAGASGNTNAEIRALKFEPLQLRIANSIARSPDRSKGMQMSSGPETARIVDGKIRIAASDPE